MDAINFNFFMQKSKKRLKLFKYFKNKIFPNGILFLQETHSTKENEVMRKDESDGNFYFSHSKSNLCGVLIRFSGNKTCTVKKRLCDENGRILILKTLIYNSEFILINFCNANTKSEQNQTFNELNMLLSNLGLSSENHNFYW